MNEVYHRFRRAEHGGKGIVRSGYLDFSASLNPCPPALDWHLPDDNISKYPDDSYAELKEVIARHHHRNAEEITVGNGSAEVIRTLCHTILSPGTTACIPPHTFSEYALSASLAGASVITSPRAQTRITFLCNPDNPSGILIGRAGVLKKRDDLTTCGSLLCVDEAFIDLADPDESVSDIRDSGMFVLRSLTKSFSMAGARFGYGIGDADLINAMEVMRPPWSVNAFAESMAIQAFRHYPELEESRRYIRQERERISSRCREMGLHPSPASANFILLETGMSASTLVAAMEREGILIRDCTSFDLPSSVRVAVRRRDENTLMLEALERCMPS